jgi:hypothetical protein
MAERVILFLYDTADRAAAGAVYQSEAADLGFRAVSADWRMIQPAPCGVVVVEGRETSPAGSFRRIVEEHVRPAVLVHRKPLWGQSEDLVSGIWHSDRPLCSFHPIWREIGDKWTFEACFQKAERRGVTVPRPRTYLVEKQDIGEVLAEAGRTRRLIFKPAAASLCEGILLSSPADFSSIVQAVVRSKWSRYVVQELENSLLYRERRFDLRVYALVTSFDPLRYKVMREGVVRLAAREPDPAAPTDPLTVLTGCSYRRRQGVSTENASISELLVALQRGGLDTHAFWDDVEHLMTKVFMALSCSGALAAPDGFSGRFYLAGMDIMMVASGDSYSLLFLETNYVPDLVGWGAEVDAQLRPAHRQWLAELAVLQADWASTDIGRSGTGAWRSWSRRRPRPLEKFQH